MAGPIGRAAELEALDAVLARATTGSTSSGLVGPAGIGKTELLTAASELARQRGFEVVSLRPTGAEAHVANAGLRDVVGQLDPDVLARLPAPQRMALAAAVADGAPAGSTDHLAVLAAVHGALELASTEVPVLVTVDDLHWLDTSSHAALRFAARRTVGSIGFLWTRRTFEELPEGPDGLGDRDVLFHVGGLPPPVIRDVVLDRSPFPVDRAVLGRIVDLADGNPFVALQLAAGVGRDGRLERLPRSLDALISVRLSQVPPEAHDVLATASALDVAAVELLRGAVDRPDTLVDALHAAEEAGVVRLDGGAVTFTHPLLRHGCYAAMPPSRRRAVHGRLAGLVTSPEERARHLALAAIEPDGEVLAEVDAAARVAARRGAPGEAAELLELGLRLGVDEPESDRARRIEAASHHLALGDLRRAAALLDAVLEERVRDEPATGVGDAVLGRAWALRSSVWSMEGDLFTSADGFERAMALELDTDDRLGAALQRAFLLTNTGRLADARRLIETIEEEDVEVGASMRGALLATSAMVRFLSGDRLDWETVTAAVELCGGPGTPPVPITSRPLLVKAILLHLAGRLPDAVDTLRELRRQLREEGNEAGLARVDFWVADSWCGLGRFDEAADLVDEATRRAQLLGSPFAEGAARAAGATLAAWQGDPERCRVDADAAIDALGPGSPQSVWPTAAAGLVALSAGDLAAAAARYEPLAAVAAAMGMHQGAAAWWTPDLVEVLCGLGRVDEARTLLDGYDTDPLGAEAVDIRAIERRCRGIVAAAVGDLEEAEAQLRAALDEHRPGGLALARARTELHLGALLRRRGRRRDASDVLQEALSTFDDLDSRCWAAQARRELDRLGLRPRPDEGLTPTEREIAALVARGLTNREIAGNLHASPKTVESHLTRIYRKVGVRGRAELVALVAGRSTRVE